MDHPYELPENYIPNDGPYPLRNQQNIRNDVRTPTTRLKPGSYTQSQTTGASSGNPDDDPDIFNEVSDFLVILHETNIVLTWGDHSAKASEPQPGDVFRIRDELNISGLHNRVVLVIRNNSFSMTCLCFWLHKRPNRRNRQEQHAAVICGHPRAENVAIIPDAYTLKLLLKHEDVLLTPKKRITLDIRNPFTVPVNENIRLNFLGVAEEQSFEAVLDEHAIVYTRTLGNRDVPLPPAAGSAATTHNTPEVDAPRNYAAAAARGQANASRSGQNAQEVVATTAIARSGFRRKDYKYELRRTPKEAKSKTKKSDKTHS
jgi:hypothetical protein